MPISDFFSSVLFDMDGTLVDSEPLWLESEQELTGRYGYDWTPADQARCLGGPLDRVGRYMFELTQAETPEFFTNTLIELMAQKLRSGARLMPGSKELMDLLGSWDIPMALVSASPRVLVDAVLDNLDSHPFQISVSSDDVEKVKPHPEGYIKAANFLEVSIADSLILEDSQTGVQAATMSGAWVIAIPHLVHIDPSERVITRKSLEELNERALENIFREWVPSSR